MVLYHNYEFWNYRSMRHYLHFLTDLAHKAEMQNLNKLGSQQLPHLYEDVIVRYIGTINKPAKKRKILDELSGKIIE